MIGPLLPARAHTLQVLRREENEYVPLEVRTVARDGLPAWLDDFKQRALAKYEKEKEHVKPGHTFVWPERVAAWDGNDVDQWFENDDLRIRAVAVNTQDLIVDDQKAMGSAPTYQPTQSWTRGVQFIMAGGAMGTLAAVNDEVERGHLANISLILFVIFVLHSVTYRSAVSGGIIFLQLATATLLSLAYMAVRGVGLNISASASASTTRSTSSTASARRWRCTATWTRRSAPQCARREWQSRSPARRWSAASASGCSRTCVSRRRWRSS
jgi:hypothetical protein